MTKQVFLSFSLSDIILCDATYKYLNEHNYSCWRFLEQNRVGDRWLNKIRTSISSSAAVVSLVSPQYLTSEICRAEFELALELGIPIFPLRCGELKIDGIPHQWRSLVFQELRAEYDIPSLDALFAAMLAAGVPPRTPTAAMTVYRPNKFQGGANDFSIIYDGKLLGILRNGETYECEVDAGEHVLRVEYSTYHPPVNIRDSGSIAEGQSPDFTFHFVAGKSYLFEAGYVGGLEGFFSGWFGPSKLYFQQQ
jgi:TIR domain